jgi:hypothetical protein
MKIYRNSVAGPVFLTSGSGSVGRIECMGCHASIIIKDIASRAAERVSRRFVSNHRRCVRKQPSRHEFAEARARADRELGTYDNSN